MNSVKPPKPFPDFPLYAHGNGQWAKMVEGKRRYYGPWANPQAALKKFYRDQEGTPDTLKTCVEKYVASRGQLQESGDISQRHVKDIQATLNRLVAIVGNKLMGRLESADFGLWRTEVAKTNKSPVALGNHIIRVRAFLNWCKHEKFITEVPQSDHLKKPSRRVLRVARATRGSRMFEPKELQQLLISAGPQMRAMILLALNAALGNHDLAPIPFN